MWDGTIPALANQHTGMRPYQFTPGDEAALRALPELRAVTGFLQRNDLYEVSAYANSRVRWWAWSPITRRSDLFRWRRAGLWTRPTWRSGGGWWCLVEGATLLFPAVRCWRIDHDQRYALTVIGRVATISRGNNDFDNQKVTSR